MIQKQIGVDFVEHWNGQDDGVKDAFEVQQKYGSSNGKLDWKIRQWSKTDGKKYRSNS